MTHSHDPVLGGHQLTGIVLDLRVVVDISRQNLALVSKVVTFTSTLNYSREPKVGTAIIG